MADKKIYVTHDFQDGAKVKNLKLPNIALPTEVEGGVAYSDGLYVSDDSSWNEVATDTNTITLINKTIDAGDA